MWKVYLLEHQMIVQPLFRFASLLLQQGFIFKFYVLLFGKPLRHLSIYQEELFMRLKLACIKNQNIWKTKSKFERPFDDDNGQFTG